MAVLRGICISELKGTQKHEVPQAELIEEWGVEGDAHAGKWHRQVSLLGLQQIEDFRAKGADVKFGAFGENLIVDGYRMKTLPVGTRLTVGDTLLEITQIGKECHSHCQIYDKMGYCIMPVEGVFARVLKGGTIRCGDEISIIDKENDGGNKK